MHLLALSGSLRAASYNTMALRALQKLAPEGIAFTLYEGIGDLPHFNYDVEMSALPEIVAELRRLVSAANGLVIACPEYAHGIPGSFKNALDWLVGLPDFPGKPVMLINTSPRATHAQAALREVLQTMSARLVPEADVTIELRNTHADAPEVAQSLQAGLATFITICRVL
jgi:NAD(P)H-dependent FMN reductase